MCCFFLKLVLWFYRKSGVTDYYATDDEHALHITRRIIKNINKKKSLDVSILILL